jgi:predicted secreted protein
MSLGLFIEAVVCLVIVGKFAAWMDKKTHPQAPKSGKIVIAVVCIVAILFGVWQTLKFFVG